MLKSNKQKTVWDSVTNDYKMPFASEYGDLIRLHYLITSRKVTTILEFGVGKSSIVFDHALEQNKVNDGGFVRDNLRRSNAFECHSVDSSKKWINHMKSQRVFRNVFLYHSDCRMSTFNGRVCTFYDKLPNVAPDFIYLDAPDQYSVGGEIRGISTRHPDRLPMAADILAIEHFLLPGTLVVVDGRTANARFIRSNLQRDWKYTFNPDWDQHFFELVEDSLGYFNSLQLEYVRRR